MSAKRITIDAGFVEQPWRADRADGADATRITVVGAVDNSNAARSPATASTNIEAGSLTNHGGTVRAAETSNLAVVVAGLLDNSNKGVIVQAATPR
jgi:filamentous hemagglutinin